MKLHDPFLDPIWMGRTQNNVVKDDQMNFSKWRGFNGRSSGKRVKFE